VFKEELPGDFSDVLTPAAPMFAVNVEIEGNF
jgi:hypothetical protein